MTYAILLILGAIAAAAGLALLRRSTTGTLLLLGLACAFAAAAEAVRGQSGLAAALAVWAVCFPTLSEPVSRLRFSYSTSHTCGATSTGAASGEQVPCVRRLMHYGFHRDAHGVQWRTPDRQER